MQPNFHPLELRDLVEDVLACSCTDAKTIRLALEVRELTGRILRTDRHVACHVCDELELGLPGLLSYLRVQEAVRDQRLADLANLERRLLKAIGADIL